MWARMPVSIKVNGVAKDAGAKMALRTEAASGAVSGRLKRFYPVGCRLFLRIHLVVPGDDLGRPCGLYVGQNGEDFFVAEVV